MEHKKEPNGVDFFVNPTPFSNKDRLLNSELIVYYKKPEKKLPTAKATSKKSVARPKKITVA